MSQFFDGSLKEATVIFLQVVKVLVTGNPQIRFPISKKFFNLFQVHEWNFWLASLTKKCVNIF